MHVESGLCRCLDIEHVEAGGGVERVLVGDLSTMAEVGLVPDEDAADVRGAMGVEFVEPCVDDGVDGVKARKVENEGDGMRAAVIGRCERAEALLPRRVPDLELGTLAVDVHRAHPEVHADRRRHPLAEGAVGKPRQQARLPHPRVADQQHLEQVVELSVTVTVAAVHAGSRALATYASSMFMQLPTNFVSERAKTKKYLIICQWLAQTKR